MPGRARKPLGRNFNVENGATTRVDEMLERTRQPLGASAVETGATRAREPSPAPSATGSDPDDLLLPFPDWLNHLLQNFDTVGMRVQLQWPDIAPCRGGQKENDPYGRLETFRISCYDEIKDVDYTAVVHSAVVLGQSAPLREAVARRRDPESAVWMPIDIKWWHVAWALEWMYEGRISSFEMLAGIELPDEYPDRKPRSVVSGLLELWAAGDYFGLAGLKRRARQAFLSYMWSGLRIGILVHRGAYDEDPYGEEHRIQYEFSQAAFRIFGGTIGQPDYINWLVSDNGYVIQRCDIAQDEDELRAWEESMFDKQRSVDGHNPPELSAIFVPPPRGNSTFRFTMLRICVFFSNYGLFDLEWFQVFVSELGPPALAVLLHRCLSIPTVDWPRDEYPRAPFSFVRVNPWRLIASNARPVPLAPEPGDIENE